MNIKQKRVEALESKVFVDTEVLPEGVFIRCVDASKDAPPPGPVKGWSYNEHRILRAGNEADGTLTQRAIEHARSFLAKRAVPVFLSIND